MMEITYIANNGFIISSDNKKIIIDGLFGRGEQHDAIETPSHETLSKLENAKEPFDKVDLVAASHVHWDHFDPLLTIEFLKHNSKAFFISTEQVYNSIKETPAYCEALQNQLIVAPGSPAVQSSFNINGIDVRTLVLKHSPYYEKDNNGKMYNRHENIQNLGFIFTIENKKIFHCGDADVLDLNENELFELGKENFDVVFQDRGIMYLDDPQKIDNMLRFLHPSHIILMHACKMEKENLVKLKNEHKKLFPQVEIFMNSLDTLII